ncbi:GGDEF domain-containing protein, partial [Campylobacter mucosalis]|uniref:GGDEF domain-containing protein n=1 Tax=Campylobacter mucosalis TaxID=202 RepID=UPI0014702502
MYTSTDVFVWGKEFETNVKKIDSDHRYLIELINSLGRKLSGVKVTIADIDPIFKELIDYSRYHFAGEEAIMKNAGVDIRHIKEHVQAHKNFIEEVTSQYKSINIQNIQKSAKSLLDFLVQWLTFHILGIDKNLTAQIRLIESGYSPEDAFVEINGINHEQIDTLVKSFNGIFGVLMRYNDELLTLKKSLEDTVEQRTKELKEANLELEKVNKKLEHIAMTDQLTGLANRHKMLNELDDCWKNFIQNGTKFSFLMFDLDNFKIINDTFGHDAGDKVLSVFSKMLLDNVRTDDIVCRMGGDEFLIVCPNTDKNGAEILAKKIYESIKNLFIKIDSSGWQGSASIGIACVDETMNSKDDIMKKADNAVYKAKYNGKNQIFAYS